MKCFQKLKSLYTRKGIVQKELASKFGMKPASFNNKMKSCETRFNIKDLILFADNCGLNIAFIDENKNIIEILSKDDLE